MYEIKVKSSFSAAHNLRNYRGKCENLHGHNWNIEAIFAYRSLGKDGMAVDFKEAKGLLKSVLERFDHSYFMVPDNADLAGTHTLLQVILQYLFAAQSIAPVHQRDVTCDLG